MNVHVGHINTRTRRAIAQGALSMNPSLLKVQEVKDMRVWGSGVSFGKAQDLGGGSYSISNLVPFPKSLGGNFKLWPWQTIGEADVKMQGRIDVEAGQLPPGVTGSADFEYDDPGNPGSWIKVPGSTIDLKTPNEAPWFDIPSDLFGQNVRLTASVVGGDNPATMAALVWFVALRYDLV